MPKDLEVVFKMPLARFYKAAPGEACPDPRCSGQIARVDSTWTLDHFMVDAVCGTCKERWALIEEFDFQVETAPGVTTQDRMCVQFAQEGSDASKQDD